MRKNLSRDYFADSENKRFISASLAANSCLQPKSGHLLDKYQDVNEGSVDGNAAMIVSTQVECNKKEHKLTDPNDLALYLEFKRAGALVNEAVSAYQKAVHAILAEGKQFGLNFLAEAVKHKFGDVMNCKWPS